MQTQFLTADYSARDLWLGLAHKPRLAAAILGVFVLSVCMILAMFVPAVPVIHDEHAYLLAADTFVNGRLANPTHPLWQFFETFHVNQVPAYVAKYPPMQGMVLALGVFISGHAIVGVWISLALAVVAVFWMLRGWINPPWALAGAWLLVFNGMIMVNWGTGFWGGAVAMLGGALIYGAVVRLVKTPRLLEALLCGLGIVILAMSRPYEGLVACIPAAAYLFNGLWRNRAALTWRRIMVNAIAPISGVVVLGGAFMLYMNVQTSGDALTFAYKVNAETYSATPTFMLGDAPVKPDYNHPVMEKFYIDYAYGVYVRIQSFKGYVTKLYHNFKSYWGFYSPWTLTLFIAGIPWALKDKRFRFVFGSCLFFALGLSLVIAAWGHYAAPFVAMIVLAIISGLRQVWYWNPNQTQAGQKLVVVAVMIAAGASYVSATQYNSAIKTVFSNSERSKIIGQFEAMEGKDLVFVHYDTNRHAVADEWVYNSADIDAQEVVWSRDMGKEQNKKLMDYYPNRRVWHFFPDRRPMRMNEFERDGRLSRNTADDQP